MPRSARLALPAPSALYPNDPAWPTGLRDLRPQDQPAQLHIAGALPNLERAVAVVGTRHPSDDALTFARELGTALGIAGRVVISGGAHGIDSAAHRGCLDSGGSTVAVLATGLKRAYPSDHAILFNVVAAHGAIVCEEPDPSGVLAASFLWRNRLIAALAETIVVVQAPARSGALSTARWAQKLGRRLFAVPSPPWEVRGRGCLDLLRSGAQVCTSAMDVLSLPASGAGPGSRKCARRVKQRNDDEGLSESARDLWRLLRRGPRYPDELSVCLDMPAARVQEGLLSLQLRGRIRRRLDGTYERTRKS
jgi:DNA processing protein